MDIGVVKLIDIDREMRGSYLDYAMSVIVARALPDARDGLKPVHRRILYAMHDMGLRPGTPYKKSARIVGEVLGKYHPHGDSAVYDAMARMAQDFSMRYMLVDGQGNFGSIDGDSPAAMRYTEARLSRISAELLVDLEKETVNFIDNFDGTLQEPAVLPAKLPNLLLNGASGIAVGMATNIPPHNLREICDAIAMLIDHYDNPEEVAVEDLMAFVLGPDFPTAGVIQGKEGIRSAYATGRGRIVVRAKTDIEEMRGGRHRIRVTEIPYQVNKALLIEKIAALVRSGRLDSISDLRDESDRHGLRIIIELKRGAQPRKVLNQLLKYTPLQTTFSINMLALVDGEPRLISLRRALQIHIDHRHEVITRRSEHELKKARHRAHILEGLLIALNHLDEVIALIRQSPDADVAKDRLMERFGLTEIQAQAILDMQLRRLAALEREKIEQEHAEILKQIAYLEDLLAHPHKILALIKEDVLYLKEKYGDERRTTISSDEAEDFSQEDLIADEEMLISVTQRGYIKRVPAKTYRSQGRGGQGVTGMVTREEDALLEILTASTLDDILFFTDKGRVFRQRVHQLPEAERQAKGMALINILNLGADERVTATVAVPNYSDSAYLTMATVHGKVKRSRLAEFSAVRPSGIIAISLEEDDYLGWAKLTHGDQEFVIVTERGKAIRFSETEIRPQGRTGGGIRGIRLAPGDRVTSVDIVIPDANLLVITTLGYGKRTPLSAYSVQHRGGGGIGTITSSFDKTGPLAAARVVRESDQVLFVSAEGMVIRLPVACLPVTGRMTRGARIMTLKGEDQVASMTRVSAPTASSTTANNAAVEVCTDDGVANEAAPELSS